MKLSVIGTLYLRETEERSLQIGIRAEDPYHGTLLGTFLGTICTERTISSLVWSLATILKYHTERSLIRYGTARTYEYVVVREANGERHMIRYLLPFTIYLLPFTFYLFLFPFPANSCNN